MYNRKVVFAVSERAAMKRRVRGLLHTSWLSPLLALVMAILPMLVVAALAIWLLRPVPVESVLPEVNVVFSITDIAAFGLSLLPLFLSPAGLVEPLAGWAPLLGILLAVTVFVAMPICVSTSGYFLSFLRGKNPKPTDVYGCFSGKYPRTLGGMAYMLLWLIIWFAASFIVPTALIFSSAIFVSALGIELVTQVYIFLGILVLSVIWYIVFFFLFLNRMLAYCLTPVCIAAQPRLPARRAVRLSRKLMRGCKWRVIGLHLSFINYFLPAIISLALLPLLAQFGTQLGLAEIMQRSLRTFLIVVACANQLAWLYVGPYMAASFHAFYIERKREALMDEEVTPDDFASTPKDEVPTRAKKQA